MELEVEKNFSRKNLGCLVPHLRDRIPREQWGWGKNQLSGGPYGCWHQRGIKLQAESDSWLRAGGLC